MDVVKRQKLEADGWKVGDAADFLELSPEDVAGGNEIGSQSKNEGASESSDDLK